MTGAEFKDHRKRLRLKREQLASDLCVSVVTLDSWEGRTAAEDIPKPIEKLFHLVHCTPFNDSNTYHEDYALENTPDMFQDL